jgi:alpha-beta hydrolase superfamily lysophospholipase
VEALKFNVNNGFGRFVYDESFITGYKDYALRKVTWMPEESPRAIIMVLHDIGDHAFRFKSLADYFTPEGFGVVGIDFRGHGKSDGHSGSACYQDLLRDMIALVKHTEKSFPFLPKILYGNGLGGNLALLYAIQQTVSLAGLIASSPWLRSYYQPSTFKRVSSQVMMKFLPSWTISNHLNINGLSHNSGNNKKYEEDPLVHKRISPGLITEANRAGKTIIKNRHKCNIPLLLMHGSLDRVTSWRASAEFSHYTSNNTTFKLWEGNYHELHNEFDKEKIFEYILQWLNDITSVQRVIYGNF